MRMKISRKEAKESAYWLRLIHETNNLNNTGDAQNLIQEANELKKDIFINNRKIKIVRSFVFGILELFGI